MAYLPVCSRRWLAPSLLGSALVQADALALEGAGCLAVGSLEQRHDAEGQLLDVADRFPARPLPFPSRDVTIIRIIAAGFTVLMLVLNPEVAAAALFAACT